ncbi:SWIM zinc finger family protein [Pseudoalteromonas luteoviolacea]|uniref:SWIM-type domain-containing protein n=1 Tax=Pseudoalteromonas luteoviolacea DSM 6061 TaxID=1365250 RepID=A0A166XY27_9GAMM|nr:SWIM zinc finger domain-containing protein [Pseudoalteromonas luteoviolacea]KZN41031.1 hypothetical protein N475_01225 [Pseudoalteromonas luteoviolacea DSM 6061]MBE0386249.1 hypothetical protein [Pseudoalteromonas luteoviolacea DSM 6061]
MSPKPSIKVAFTESDIKQLCDDEKIFLKGRALANKDEVKKLSFKNEAIHAVVQGSSDYDVELDPEALNWWACNCPAARYQSMCKHIVATSLTLLRPEGATKVADSDSEREQIKQYVNDTLNAKNPDVLMQMYLDLLAKDDLLWQQMLSKALLSKGSVSYKELKSIITKALPLQDIWEWREVDRYFLNAEKQLDAIWTLLNTLEVTVQWKLLNYILERLNKVLLRIDDSSGARFGIEGTLYEHMPKVFTALPWSEDEKARWLFDNLVNPKFDVFPSIESNFASEVQTNSAFLIKCKQYIEQPQMEQGGWVSKSVVDVLLRSANSWQDKVNIKLKVAVTSRDYLEIAELCLDNNDDLDAEHWLAKARKVNDSLDTTACDRLAIKIKLHHGELKNAWKLANQVFKARPSFYEYEALVLFKKQHDIVDEEFVSRVEQEFIAATKLNTPYNKVAFENLLAFYIAQKNLKPACQLIESYNASDELKIKLANALINSSPTQSLDLYEQVVKEKINWTNNDAYQEVIKLLLSLEKKLPSKALKPFYQLIGGLAHSNKRKRNMFALFNKHFEQAVREYK